MTPEELNRINAEHHKAVQERVQRLLDNPPPPLSEDALWLAEWWKGQAAAPPDLAKLNADLQWQNNLPSAIQSALTSAAGSNKGRAAREEVLALWNDEWTGSRKNAGAFAKWAFARLGGKYGAAGEKVGNAPSERTIRKWINEN